MDHDQIILLSTPFPTITLCGANCWCNLVLFYVGSKRCCIVSYLIVSYRILSDRIVSSHRIALYRIVSHRIVLYCTSSRCIAATPSPSCRAASGRRSGVHSLSLPFPTASSPTPSGTQRGSCNLWQIVTVGSLHLYFVKRHFKMTSRLSVNAKVTAIDICRPYSKIPLYVKKKKNWPRCIYICLGIGLYISL